MPRPVTIFFAPGANLAAASINIPSYAPYMSSVVSAEILRSTSGVTIDNATVTDHPAADIAAGVADHSQANVIAALADHAAADVAAGVADHSQANIVAAIADHAVHQHDITTVAAAGGGAAMTEPAIAGPLETAGAGQTNTNAVDANAAAQAHAAGAAAVAHAAGVAVAHAAGAAPVAHAAGVAVTHAAHTHALTGASQVVAAVPTLVDNNTITLDVATNLGDLLRLTYLEEGGVLKVS